MVPPAPSIACVDEACYEAELPARKKIRGKGLRQRDLPHHRLRDPCPRPGDALVAERAADGDVHLGLQGEADAGGERGGISGLNENPRFARCEWPR